MRGAQGVESKGYEIEAAGELAPNLKVSRFSAQLNVSNVLDKKYRSGSYWWGAPYNYGEPRRVLLSMDYAF